jgi:DNA-binding CsgD family transcriptional regulator/tetratricopeptide (TPR) repeat protein
MVGRISSPRFVGRVAELDVLQRALARASSGTGTAVLVAGEAGLGKSRLVSEFAARARAREALVLIGECVELAEGELAFAPIIAALRGVVEDGKALEGIEGPMRSALAALWPVAGVDEGVDTGREQLFEAVYRVLARLAQEQVVLLIVEDVHWIDPSSRDLLGFLVRNARHNRIAVVATYRADELHRGHPLRPFIAELERSGRAERVELEPLERSQVAEQLEAIAGRAPGASVVDGIFVRCEGNPFFAEELLAGAGAGGGELPVSLREALLLRVDRLSDVTRAVLRAAAVVGRSVDHRLLAEVTGVAESELLVALREATDHHVLVSSGSGRAYMFRHALLREAVYDDTLVGERLRLHRAIAETLEQHREYAGSGAAAELAYHWLAAGEEQAALVCSAEAATEAEAMHAYGEAVGHLGRAAELWDRVEPAPDRLGFDRIDLLLQASRLADYAGDAENAIGLAEQARAGLDERAEPVRTATAERRIGRAMMFGARAADAIEHMAAARRLAPKDPPSLEYLEALSAEGRLMMVNARMLEARDRLEEAIPLAERLGARALLAGSLSALGIVYADLGEFERAIAAGRESVRLAEESGSPEQIARAYINGSQAIDDAGRLEEALELGIRGIGIVDRLGLSRGPGDHLREQAAWRLQRIGQLAEAERTLQPVLDNATSPFHVAGSHLFAGRLAVERDELDRAEQLLDSAWALGQRSGGFQVVGLAIAARVLLEIRRGELERARERAREGLECVAGVEGDLIYNAEIYWLAVRIEADLAERARTLRDDEAVDKCETNAVAVLDALTTIIGKVPGDGAPPEARAFHALAEAELARLRGERTVAPWEVAAERFRSLGTRYPAAYAELRAAEALAVSGARSAEIAVRLRAAYEVALEVGAPRFLEDVTGLARRAGISLGTREADRGLDAAGEFGLTDRELEVLCLLADGRTNRQIGEELFITPKTASVHVSRILMKLGVTNRAEAAAAAHRMGLARQVGVD